MRSVFRNIVRFPKKTLVIFILVSIILLLSMSGMFIVTLCEEISGRTIGPLGDSVVVTDNDGGRIMLYEAARDICNVSPVIESVEAVAEYDVQPIGLKCIDGSDTITVEYSRYRYSILKIREGDDSIVETTVSRDMKLTAVTTNDICREFYSGEAALVEGSLISREDCDSEVMKIVVSDRFAEMNGLKLGDRVTINALSMFIAPSETTVYTSAEKSEDGKKTFMVNFLYDDYYIDLGEKLSTMTFTVGGIYRNLVGNRNTAATAANINDNRVYVPISVVSRKLEDINRNETFKKHKDDYLYLSVLMPWSNNKIQYMFPQDLRCVPTRLYLRLTDMSVAGDLEDAINRLDFYSEIKITPFTNEAGTSPAAKILIIVRYSLLGVMATGFVILLLVIISNKNARKREFAVLAALGMKRLKIALSFFGEVFVIFIAALFVCATAYVFTVRAIAAPVSGYLENYEATADSREVRMSSASTENDAELQRSENATDFGYQTENYILPSLWITVIGAIIVLFTALLPVYFTIKKLNPLIDSGGKD